MDKNFDLQPQSKRETPKDATKLFSKRLQRFSQKKNSIIFSYSFRFLLSTAKPCSQLVSYLFPQAVEVLIAGNANFEHRNVSDYTPLSLAASGGYIGIVKILLAHGAEINSRTGSKLGISPLMLASMNGHTSTVKLLLDMGADINAQIETNRNTALTLACFQGRGDVVSLLVERRANIEHRAKVGLIRNMFV